MTLAYASGTRLHQPFAAYSALRIWPYSAGITNQDGITFCLLSHSQYHGRALDYAATDSDKGFLVTAAQSDQNEIASSQLADHKATNPTVKTFAVKMVTEQTKMTDSTRLSAAGVLRSAHSRPQDDKGVSQASRNEDLQIPDLTGVVVLERGLLDAEGEIGEKSLASSCA